MTADPETVDMDVLIENVRPELEVEEVSTEVKQTTRKRKPKSEKFGTNESGRNCLTCGKPKSRSQGANNLHYTYVRRGEVSFENEYDIWVSYRYAIYFS